MKFLQQAGYKALGNLLSSSKNLSRELRKNKKINFAYFDENKEYQRSKYKKFYQWVREGLVQTVPDLVGTNLSNREISNQITICYSNRFKLEAFPPLPNCQELYCENNLLTSLPNLPLCKKLNCRNNQLTTLPPLSECKDLNCGNNRLTTLPSLPNCEIIFCDDNRLTVLPPSSEMQNVVLLK
jgi:Leucine-rich repeat (LRR) protein